MINEERRQLGFETIGRVYGKLPEGSITPPGESRFIDYMLETIFGELWTNKELSFKERRLLLLGVIAAQGQGDVFSIQAESALDNGELTPAQLKEIVVFLAPYAGYPKVSNLYVRVNELLKRREMKAE